jgi:predicted ATPase/DNA-binding CsgD family transcriptional regulator
VTLGALAAASGGVHGFTPALTSFVGRHAEVDDVAGLLGEYRLVTVTGAGGVGKTRLAAEVARGVASRFADGVWMAELATVQDPALVPAAVAVALGVRDVTGTSLSESMATVLSRRQLLLVLDNCEHVLAAAAGLCGALLPFADDVQIMATSRERLGVAGEARYRLAPLALSAPDEPGGIACSEAMLLFADRARQADARFTLGAESGPAVARIVRRLDGLPLAIELAAARVEALGVAQLADRLDDRLLSGTDRLVPDRHRSLAATTDWSYQLLGEQEREVFCKLAVFPGPFTLEAAQEVTGPDSGSVVLRLVDCSLLAPPRTGKDGRVRYLMLETLRTYARGRLSQAGQEQETVAALAGYALRVAEQAAAGLESSAGELPAATLLDAEGATMQRGLAWALEHDPASAVRLAVALAPWWSLRGRYADGYELLSAASLLVTQGGPYWCTAQFWLGRLATGTDEAAGLRHFAAARDALVGGAPSPLLIQSLAGCADCLLNLGRAPEAEEQARHALEMARELSHPEGEARALCWLGACAYYAGDLAACLAWWMQAQRISPASIPGSLVRRNAVYLAAALVDAGEFADAKLHCGRALSLAREAGALFDQADGLMLMATIDRLIGSLPEARAHLAEAMELATRIGHDLLLHDCLDASGHLSAQTQRYPEAITVWAADGALRQQGGIPDPPHDAQRREEPLRRARHALGAERVRIAEARGTAMTLPIAAEYAVLLAADETYGAAQELDMPQLSARERELVTLVAQGCTNAQIAEQLYISIRTVGSHLDRIRDKTGCRRRADLTRLALHARLV